MPLLPIRSCGIKIPSGLSVFSVELNKECLKTLPSSIHSSPRTAQSIYNSLTALSDATFFLLQKSSVCHKPSSKIMLFYFINRPSS